MSSDDVLTQAAQRAEAVMPGDTGKYVRLMLDWCRQTYTQFSVPSQIADKLAVAVLALPVPAPDQDAVLSILAEIYGMEDHPDHQRAADRLISAGLVRTPEPALDRETLGQKVREVWIDWASEQPNPKASWLVPWEGLSEPDREVDRRIGEELAAIGAASVRAPVTVEQIKAASDALLPVLGNPDGLAALSTLIGTRKLVDRAVRAVIATLGLSVAEGGDHGQ